MELELALASSKGQRLLVVVRAPVQTDKTVESIQEILKEYDNYLTCISCNC